MCGIAAIFNYRESSPADRAEMQRYLAHMQRRGPDGQGQWSSPDESVCLGHRRLAIIDLSDNGVQPMTSVSGRSVITFNGEIYNYKELRADLLARGRTFRSSSDTEVLLELYEELGQDMVHKLRGMFTFAIWDNTKRGLFVARDHLGIKPLYYSDDGKCFRLASQVKALLAGHAVNTEPDPAGHVGFFLWGHIPDPYTLYKNIRALPAGSTLWIDCKSARTPRSYCSITQIFADAERAVEGGSWKMEVGSSENSPHLPTANSQLREFLREKLLDTVRHHLVADVPVGVFLSAGLDSTTIAALAREVGGNLRTVTLGFNEYRGTANDETILAETVARQYGAQHQTVWVTRKDFQKNYRRLLDAMDRPTCDGVNSFFISSAARESGLKVALSGVGGDEIFGGYSSFREIPQSVNVFKRFNSSAFQPFNRAVRAVAAPLLRHFTSPKYAGLLEYGGSYGGAYLLRRGMFMPWELPGLLDPEIVREGWSELQTLSRLDACQAGIRSPRLKVSALELQWYMRHQLLVDTDWASMDHSIEIRTPLVDIELLKSIARISASNASLPTKLDMAMSPHPGLPAAVLNRSKTGFCVPVRQWLEESGVADGEAPLSAGNSAGGERGLRTWARIIFAQAANN